MINQTDKNLSDIKKDSTQLTGIERQLVLQYLMDANVPVTVTEEPDFASEKDLEDKKADKEPEIRTVASGVFPVALPGEQLTVLDQGIILLKNPPESVKVFNGKRVRVQFYFNRLGLYFITTVKNVKSGLALVIPAVINKIQEKKSVASEKFSALLCFSTSNSSSGTSVNCGFLEDYRLFVSPKWSDIEEENQIEAKNYLERFVMLFRSVGKAMGNGLFFISVVRFLSDKKTDAVSSVEGRKNPPKIIYIDGERLVFAANKEDILLKKGEEYSVVLSFPIERGPVKERTVYAIFIVEDVFEDSQQKKACAVCTYTDIKKEDVRYLEDKKM